MAELPDDVKDVQELGRVALKVLGHSKFLSLSAAAGWLWMRGLVYLTAGNGTLGGLITDAAFKQIGGTPVRAEELVAAGLWRRDQDGWRMRRLNAPVVGPPPKKKAPPAHQPAGTEVMRFPIVGQPGFWILTKEQVEEWQKTYTSVDVLAECGYAKAWVDADPADRKKTMRGMPKFLVRWLSRAVDDGRRGRGRGGPQTRGKGAGLTGPAPAGKYDHLSRSDDDG